MAGAGATATRPDNRQRKDTLPFFSNGGTFIQKLSIRWNGTIVLRRECVHEAEEGRAITMDLDFLEEGSRDCPLIRIYGTDYDDHCRLTRAIADIAAGTVQRLPIQELPGFGADPNFELILRTAAKDEGVSRHGQSLHFVWALTPGKWRIVEGLARPLADFEIEGCYQWLAGPEARYGLDVGSVSVLLSNSHDGHW